MATKETVEVDIDVKTNADEAGGKVKSLKLQLKEARLAFEQLQLSGKATADELAKAANKVDDLGDKIDRAKFGAQDFTDKIASLPGPLGALGSGLKSAKDSVETFGKTLTISLGIVGLLVTAFFAIKSALEKTKEGQEGLSKATTALNKVLAPFFAILEKVGNIVLPIITKGFEVLGTVMSKVAKFFGVSDTKITEVTASLEENNEAANKLAEDEKKRLDKAEADKKKADEKAKARLETNKANLETENKLKEAALAKDKAIAMQTAFNEEQKIGVEAEFAKKSYDLQIAAIEAKQKLYDKDSNEYKDLQAQKITAEGAYITKTGELKTQLQKVYKDNGDVITQFENKLAEDLRKIDEKKAADALKNAAIKKGEDDAKYSRLVAGAQSDLDLQRQLLENKKKLDDEYYAKQLAAEGLTTEQIRELNDRKLADQIYYTDKSNEIEKNRIAVKQQALNDIISIVGAESAVGKAALVAKQILSAKELILEISRTITFSAQAAARSVVAVAEGTAQTAKVGFPQNIPLLIGYAAQAFGIISAIKSAVSSAKSSASGNGSGMTSISAPPPIYGGTPAVSTPQIQGTAATTPGSQIAQTIVASSGKPVKAYVVSGDISSQQALDRKTNRGATFGLG